VRLDATADVSKAKDWVNQVYADVCVQTEALQDYADMVATANTSVYDLDTDIVRIKQMYVTPTGQGQSRPLIPTSIEQILEWSYSNGATSTNSGAITHYAMFGIQKIQFYPTPTAADTITVYYVKQPTALDLDADIPVLQEPYVSNLLVNGACFEAAVFLKDPDALLFKQLYDEGLKEYRSHLRAREGSMTRQFRFTGGDRVTPHDRSVDIRW
jgi:hypothetical protein